MEQFLLIIHVVIATALIGVVLIQRSDTDGFGLGSGSGSNLLSGRAAASLLTRTTAILATLFIINSLALSIIAAHGHQSSIVDTISEQESDGPSVPVAVEQDKDSKAVAPILNRDEAMDTNAAAKKASAKRAKPAPVKTDDAPAVPTAE